MGGGPAGKISQSLFCHEWRKTELCTKQLSPVVKWNQRDCHIRRGSDGPRRCRRLLNRLRDTASSLPGQSASYHCWRTTTKDVAAAVTTPS
ncbi:hypothetical protein LZ554_003500 [Drepanopeziza brunnea f. sp. 'monogermtubi']|nr:hypothetical protein LZ554_003500 [Drepanopeziza brunnea f. sp. 'monogermtubi']